MVLLPWNCRMPAFGLMVATLSCVAGCSDNPAAAAPVAGGRSRFTGTVVCAVDVRAAHSRCELITQGVPGSTGARLAIIPNAQTMVQTGADGYTAVDSTYRLNIRLINTSETPLGTRDGTTVTGIKAFIPVNIMGYAGRPPGYSSSRRTEGDRADGEIEIGGGAHDRRGVSAEFEKTAP